jgi:hypothetical protein
VPVYSVIRCRFRAFWGAGFERFQVPLWSVTACRIAPCCTIKGKSAIHLARTYGEHRRNFVGQSFWARGYFVSTVGRDEEVIRNYIRNQEQEDQRLDQMNLWR